MKLAKNVDAIKFLSIFLLFIQSRGEKEEHKTLENDWK